MKDLSKDTPDTYLFNISFRVTSNSFILRQLVITLKTNKSEDNNLISSESNISGIHNFHMSGRCHGRYFMAMIIEPVIDSGSYINVTGNFGGFNITRKTLTVNNQNTISFSPVVNVSNSIECTLSFE